MIALDTPEAAIAAFEAEARLMQLPLKILRDTLADKRAAYGAKMILVRPDQFVAWTSDEPPSDARAILQMAIGGLIRER